MIPTPKNFFASRTRRVTLLALWLALSAMVVLALPGSSSPSPAASQSAADEISTATEKTEPASGNPASAPAAVQNNQPSGVASETQSRPASDSAPSPKPAPAKIKVSLTINDDFAGNVTLPAGSNNCDVLSQALKDGLISGLEMRYSEAHKSYGVYMINGVGDSANIWWAYKVNGRSPPLGCSHIKVNSGDAIKWEYVS